MCNSLRFFRLIFELMVVLVMGALVIGVYAFYTESFGSFWEYSSFEISDWLINYEGGFVRRGLVGQLLYFLYQIHPYPVRYAIVFLYILGFVILSGLLIVLFKKEGLSIFIIPFTICLYYSFTCDMLWTRRDYWSLFLAFLIYLSYNKLSHSFSIKHLIVFYLLSAITLLMHEASFFYTFPILAVFGYYAAIKLGNLRRNNIVKTFLGLPIIILFVIVLFYKGNEELMTIVWRSWTPCFQAYPTSSGNIPDIGNGVEFLNMSSMDAILLHIRLVWLARFAPYVPSFPFNIYLIICTYYLVTRINTVDLKWYRLRPVNNILLSNIVIIQFVFLFPMFGFLSCDLGRVIPYWVISSLLLYCVVAHTRLIAVPRILNTCSEKIQNRIDSNKWLNNPWVYVALIITLPLKSYYGATYGGMIPVYYFLKVMKFFSL